MILLDHLQLCLDNIKNLKPYSNILTLKIPCTEAYLDYNYIGGWSVIVLFKLSKNPQGLRQVEQVYWI
jgi:hypothetical protein